MICCKKTTMRKVSATNSSASDSDGEVAVKCKSVDDRSLCSEKSSRSGSKPVKLPPQEEILFQKRNILHEFERLASKGFTVPKFSMASNYEEMRFEYDHIKKTIEVDGSVKFQRSCILGLISAVEFLNNRYDPFEIKLDGWTEQISGRIETFDDVMEEIFHKYKNKMKMAPELSLACALASSMFFVHLANTAFKPSSQSVPTPVTSMADKPGMAKSGNDKSRTPVRPSMRGPVNVSDMMRSINNDDAVSIMSDSSDATEVSRRSYGSSRITTVKKKDSTTRRTMHID